MDGNFICRKAVIVTRRRAACASFASIVMSKEWEGWQGKTVMTTFNKTVSALDGCWLRRIEVSVALVVVVRIAKASRGGGSMHVILTGERRWRAGPRDERAITRRRADAVVAAVGRRR